MNNICKTCIKWSDIKRVLVIFYFICGLKVYIRRICSFDTLTDRIILFTKFSDIHFFGVKESKRFCLVCKWFIVTLITCIERLKPFVDPTNEIFKSLEILVIFTGKNFFHVKTFWQRPLELMISGQLVEGRGLRAIFSSSYGTSRY